MVHTVFKICGKMCVVSMQALHMHKILFFLTANTVLYIFQKNGAKRRIHLSTGMEKESVLFAIRTGHNNAIIAKFFDLMTTWVWKVRNQLEESGGDMKLWQKDLVTKEGLTASELPNHRPG